MMANTPLAPAAGVPERVAVPFALSAKVTPAGSAPDSVSVGTLGNSWPVVTVKLPFVPAVNVVLAALVIVGASSTVSVKVCSASGLIPLCARMVRT